jgi:hypothetical protein
MKFFFTIIALVSSVYSYACLDISGKYLCPEDAELVLGTSEVEFRKSPIVDIYSMRLGDSATIYEVGSWNPAMNPNTGEIDFSTQTMAECRDKSVLLRSQSTMTEGEVEVTISGGFKVTPISKGIQLKIILEGDETIKFDCRKL